MSVLEPGVRPRRIVLRPGEQYTARLHGGAQDGLDFHPVAEGAEPNPTLQVPEDDGTVSSYVWNGFLAENGSGVSAGYTYCAAPTPAA
jgi:hypothetical protein